MSKRQIMIGWPYEKIGLSIGGDREIGADR